MTTPAQDKFNGRNPKKGPSRDQTLKNAALMVKSARENFLTPAFMPNDIEELKLLGRELITWAMDTDSTNIDDFFSLRKISPRRFLRTCKTNEYLSDCLDVALAQISKRINGIVKDLHMYQICNEKRYNCFEIEDKEWRRQESIAKREAESNNNVVKIYKEEAIGIPVFTAKDKE